MYDILKGYKFSVGKIIENSILSYYRGSYRGLVPHPALITRPCILGGVEGDWKEEETCPKTSPLTLTGIIKGPKNKGKAKIAEPGREKGDNIEINQIQFENATQEHQQRQKSLSPILTLSPDLRQTHQEPSESSAHHSNTTELMEMLKAMRQEMQEGDKQLKIQLQLWDEYMDTKLRRRD